MEIYYTATARFGPTHEPTVQGRPLDWKSYVVWSRLAHLREVITLDSLLAPPAFERDIGRDAEFMVWESYIPNLYTSPAYLVSRLTGLDPATYNLLAVAREPATPCQDVPLDGFEFVGYDLLDVYGDISALTNCGGFDNAFLPRDLNAYGLLSTHYQAYQVKAALLANNPDASHAECLVWGIWRRPDERNG